MRIQIRRLAREDVNSAFDWYQGQDRDLGVQFYAELEHVLERVSLNPSQFPVVQRDIHRALLKHFPYAIYFVVRTSTVHVLAVPHQRQSPGLWKGRI